MGEMKKKKNGTLLCGLKLKRSASYKNDVKKLRKCLHKKEKKTKTLRKEILKRDEIIEKLKKNNFDLARQLEEVKKSNNKLSYLELKEKVEVYEKNIFLINQSLSRTFPYLMRITEEFGAQKSVVQRSLGVMANNSVISAGATENNLRNNIKVNQVVPMVQGVGIHKPFIALKRYNLLDSNNIPSPIREEEEEEERYGIGEVPRRHRSRLGRRNGGLLGSSSACTIPSVGAAVSEPNDRNASSTTDLVTQPSDEATAPVTNEANNLNSEAVTDRNRSRLGRRYGNLYTSSSFCEVPSTTGAASESNSRNVSPTADLVIQLHRTDVTATLASIKSDNLDSQGNSNANANGDPLEGSSWMHSHTIINNSVLSSDESIKPCFVPVTSVPLKKRSGSVDNSKIFKNINNLVVSLPRTDFLLKGGKSADSTSQLSEENGKLKKKNSVKSKKLSQDQEMAKENVPDSGKAKKRTKSPENSKKIEKRQKKFLSPTDCNTPRESTDEFSSLHCDSSDLMSTSGEEKRSLRNRGPLKSYKEPDVRSKKRRD